MKKILTGLATIVALGAVQPAHAQWAQEGMTFGKGGRYVARIEGGTGPMNYGFLDVYDDGTRQAHFLQAQVSKAFGKGAIKPTLGFEYQATNDPNINNAQDVLRFQVGADANWKGGFGGIRIAPDTKHIGFGDDNDLQLSISGQHKIGRLTVGFWRDMNFNRGQKPFHVGEINADYELGKPFGAPVFVTGYKGTNVAGTDWRVGLKANLTK